jgi:hypothetical protein
MFEYIAISIQNNYKNKCTTNKSIKYWSKRLRERQVASQTFKSNQYKHFLKSNILGIFTILSEIFYLANYKKK